MGTKGKIGTTLMMAGVLSGFYAGAYTGYCDLKREYLDDMLRNALNYGPTILSALCSSVAGLLMYPEGVEKLAKEGKTPPAYATPAVAFICNGMVGAAGAAATTWMGNYMIKHLAEYSS